MANKDTWYVESSFLVSFYLVWWCHKLTFVLNYSCHNSNSNCSSHGS